MMITCEKAIEMSYVYRFSNSKVDKKESMLYFFWERHYITGLAIRSPNIWT